MTEVNFLAWSGCGEVSVDWPPSFGRLPFPSDPKIPFLVITIVIVERFRLVQKMKTDHKMKSTALCGTTLLNLPVLELLRLVNW